MYPVGWVRHPAYKTDRTHLPLFTTLQPPINCPPFSTELSHNPVTRLTMQQLGMIGLGRMGANMVRRLIKVGHQCVVYDMHAEAVKALVQPSVVGAASLKELVA